MVRFFDVGVAVIGWGISGWIGTVSTISVNLESTLWPRLDLREATNVDTVFSATTGVWTYLLVPSVVLANSRTGAFVLSGGMDQQVRVWERTQDIVFLEEERECRLEQIFDKVESGRNEQNTGNIM